MPTSDRPNAPLLADQEIVLASASRVRAAASRSRRPARRRRSRRCRRGGNALEPCSPKERRRARRRRCSRRAQGRARKLPPSGHARAGRGPGSRLRGQALRKAQGQGGSARAIARRSRASTHALHLGGLWWRGTARCSGATCAKRAASHAPAFGRIHRCLSRRGGREHSRRRSAPMRSKGLARSSSPRIEGDYFTVLGLPSCRSLTFRTQTFFRVKGFLSFRSLQATRLEYNLGQTIGPLVQSVKVQGEQCTSILSIIEFAFACHLSLVVAPPSLRVATKGVVITTDPSGAECKLERQGKTVGAVAMTPGSIQIGRSKDDITVTCRKSGFADNSVVYSPVFNGATLGNVLAGGVIGLAVDASTGANYNYPKQIDMTLLPVGDIAAFQGARVSLADAVDAAEKQGGKATRATVFVVPAGSPGRYLVTSGR